MTQELIERLHKLADRQRRERGNAMYLGEHDPEISEAADALQSQSARIAELREVSSHLADEMDGLLPYLASHNWRLDRLTDVVSKVRQAASLTKDSTGG